MATYAYTCGTYTCEGPNQEVTAPMGEDHSVPDCVECGRPMKRNYKAERVNIGPAIGSINRDFKAAEDRDIFLPTRKDFENKHGHEGDRAVDNAIKDWNEHHEPVDPAGGKYRPK